MRTYDQLLALIKKESKNPHLAAILYLQCNEIKRIIKSELCKETNATKYEALIPFRPLLESSVREFIYTQIKVNLQETLEGSMERNSSKYKDLINTLDLNINVEQATIKEYFCRELGNLFSMIATYPQSIPQLEEFKACIPRVSTDGINQTLTQSTNTRLLHQGVETGIIIRYYANTAATSRFLGIELDKSNQVKYLSSRRDLTHSVLDYMLKSNGSRVDELVKVNKGFIKELNEWFTRELIGLKDYNHHELLLYLETSKTIFGGNALSSVQVMISDVNYSKRVDLLIHSRLDNPVFPCVTQFDLVESWLSGYNRVYKQSSNRELVWLDCGTVDLVVEFSDARSLTLTCDPLQACVLLYIQDASSRSITATLVSDELGISSDKSIKILQFWVSMNVLLDTNGTYSPIEYSSASTAQSVPCSDLDVHREPEKDHSLLCKYIVGMLRMHKQASLERIWGFCNGVLEGFDLEVGELKVVLDAFERVVLKAGVYKLQEEK